MPVLRNWTWLTWQTFVIFQENAIDFYQSLLELLLLETGHCCKQTSSVCGVVQTQMCLFPRPTIKSELHSASQTFIHERGHSDNGPFSLWPESPRLKTWGSEMNQSHTLSKLHIYEQSKLLLLVQSTKISYWCSFGCDGIFLGPKLPPSWLRVLEAQQPPSQLKAVTHEHRVSWRWTLKMWILVGVNTAEAHFIWRYYAAVKTLLRVGDSLRKEQFSFVPWV